MSVPATAAGRWQATAEIPCSHPAEYWQGQPGKTRWAAHADRVEYLKQITAAGSGHICEGLEVEYAGVETLPKE